MSLQTVISPLLSLPDWPVMAGAVVVALGVDLGLGEPRARWHPVVWMGHYLNAAGPHMAPKLAEKMSGKDAGKVSTKASSSLNEFLRGCLGWSLGALLVLVFAALASGLVLQGPWLRQQPWLQMLLLGVLLKPMLAWRMLRDEVLAVEQALSESLDAGRVRVSWLVSRDVSALEATQVREAALSTLAENLNDSVVAPLFWFAVAGLPGAALYRFANTADAMWGYPGERQGRNWAWAGKWTARVDDLLSWVPARLTAVLLGLPTFWRGMSEVMRNASLTPSPNGGWPMGALAVGLGIRLGKNGVYLLNPQGRVPLATDTARALRICGQVVAALSTVAALGVIVAWADGALQWPFTSTGWGG
jgi:adenosylcobinamide-phosphate synthase